MRIETTWNSDWMPNDECWLCTEPLGTSRHLMGVHWQVCPRGKFPIVHVDCFSLWDQREEAAEHVLSEYLNRQGGFEFRRLSPHCVVSEIHVVLPRSGMVNRGGLGKGGSRIVRSLVVEVSPARFFDLIDRMMRKGPTPGDVWLNSKSPTNIVQLAVADIEELSVGFELITSRHQTSCFVCRDDLVEIQSLSGHQ